MRRGNGQGGGLAVVIRLARDAERAAAERLRLAQERGAAAEAQLRSVQAYLSEYVQRAAVAGVRSARDVLEERRFLAQLQAMVATQRRVAGETSRQADLARAAWLEARRKREALEDLAAESARQMERRAEDRAQQQLDDLPRPGRQGLLG